MIRRAVLSVGLGLLVISACGCGGSSPSSTSAPERAGSPAPSPLRVTSSITTGATLSKAVQWSATPANVASSDPVQSVDFLIDGRVRWTEHNAPYVFNADANYLHPWLLRSGRHRLAERVATATGKTATATEVVTVAVQRALPAALVGTFQHRVLDTRPRGIWRIHVHPNGLVLFDDPMGSGGAEAVRASQSPPRLTLYGPVDWEVRKARQGGFCDRERPHAWRWHRRGADLVLHAATDPGCGRTKIFNGLWSRTQ